MPSDREHENNAYRATNEENIAHLNKVRRRRGTEKDEHENSSILSLYHGQDFDNPSTVAEGEYNANEVPSVVDENEKEEDWYTDESETDEEAVAFEKGLQHKSFYETPKNRRRRHWQYRTSGKIPKLHFAGSHKTDFWHGYGVPPDEVIERGNLKGVSAIFSEDEFNQLGPTERRIHVNGQKFKIVANEEFPGNLYRAVAQAIGKPDEQIDFIQHRIFDELDRRKEMFIDNIFKYCENNSMYVDHSSVDNHSKAVHKYKQHRRLKASSPPEFELVAAAIHFGFTYAIIELYSQDIAVKVRNCNDNYVRQKATVKYYFLRTGDTVNTLCYEFLLPIGPLVKIEDGAYPSLVREVVLVEKSRAWEIANANRIKFNPAIGPLEIGFALDHRIFLHRSTVAHDLWALLAELIFKRLVFAPQIKQRVLDSKHSFAVYYLASKAKKRYQLHGNASIQKIADEFNRRFTFEHPRGDLEDLAQAAQVYNFSYTVIGMDSMGNFFWRDCETQQKGPYLAFFVKTLPNRMHFWYALEDPGRECPLERKIYRHARAGDLSRWKGQFYFQYALENISVDPHPDPFRSADRFLNTSTRLLRGAANWSTSNVRKLRNSMVGAASTVSIMTKNMGQSAYNVISWLKSRRRVEPGKAMQSLFARDQP